LYREYQGALDDEDEESNDEDSDDGEDMDQDDGNKSKIDQVFSYFCPRSLFLVTIEQ
jgi:hypothetical protein